MGRSSSEFPRPNPEWEAPTAFSPCIMPMNRVVLLLSMLLLLLSPSGIKIKRWFMGSTVTGLRPVCVASNFDVQSDTQSARTPFLQPVRILEHRDELLKRSVHGLPLVHNALNGRERSTFNVQRSTFNVQRSTFNVQRETINHRPLDHQPVHGKRPVPLELHNAHELLVSPADCKSALRGGVHGKRPVPARLLARSGRDDDSAVLDFDRLEFPE
jgi:hypothetical protein